MIEKLCKWCERPQHECYMHCHKSDNGAHEPDPYGAIQADSTPFCVDYPCKKCGLTGGAKINTDDIYWE